MTYTKSIFLFLISTFTVIQGFSQGACDVTSDINDICIGDEVRLDFVYPAPDNFSVGFDGVNQFINVPHHPDLDFGTVNFSVEFWFKANNTAGPAIMFSKLSTAGVGYSIGINAGLLNVTLADGSGTPTVITGTTPITAGTWNHCAVTFDRAGDCRLYLQGFQDAVQGIGALGSIANADPIGIGGPAVNVGGVSAFFDGNIDEVRLWARVISAGEITGNMNTHINPTTPSGSGLNGYWDLNEGAGGFLLDCGIAQQDGSLMQNATFSNDVQTLAWNLGTTWSTGDLGTPLFVNPEDTTKYIASSGYCKYECSDSITINVLPCDSGKENFTEASVWVPKAFTPNFDTKNDVFQVKASFITYFEIMVYARNGNIVFHSKNIQNSWDGTFQGAKLKDDTYTYVVIYRNTRGEEFKKFGYVSVLR